MERDKPYLPNMHILPSSPLIYYVYLYEILNLE